MRTQSREYQLEAAIRECTQRGTAFAAWPGDHDPTTGEALIEGHLYVVRDGGALWDLTAEARRIVAWHQDPDNCDEDFTDDLDDDEENDEARCMRRR